MSAKCFWQALLLRPGKRDRSFAATLVKEQNMLGRRRAVGGTALAVASLALVACGGGESGTGETGAEGTYKAPAGDVEATLSIANWGNPGDEDIYNAAIKRFNATYPNVKVENNFSQVVNWGDYINKIQASIASGDAPDVINIATEGVEYGLERNLYQ